MHRQKNNKNMTSDTEKGKHDAAAPPASVVMWYLLRGGVRYRIGQIVKLLYWLLYGILIQVEAAEGVHNTVTMDTQSSCQGNRCHGCHGFRLIPGIEKNVQGLALRN